MFEEVRRLSEFDKDMKRLLRRFGTLEDDLTHFINAQLVLFHKIGQDNRGIVRLSGLQISYPKIYKARKFACQSLKGTHSRSGIRIIYAYFEDEDIIELIQIYYKGDKEVENRERISENYRNQKRKST